MHFKRQQFTKYLTGEGLEIGALNHPLTLPPTAKARYADVLSHDQIRALYPGARLPDIVAVGERYPGVEDDSCNFIVANHVLEHVTDPITTLIEWHRMLCNGGILFMAIPDKRYMFDRDRARTSLEHLIADHESVYPPKYLNFPHLLEWATHVEGLQPDSPEWQNWIDTQFNDGYSVHNHVWILADILALLRHLRKAHATRFILLDGCDTVPNDIEFVLVLKAKKTSQPSGPREVLSDAIREVQFQLKNTATAWVRADSIPGLYPLARWCKRKVNLA
jgi:SAM-dependent methyltransferase